MTSRPPPRYLPTLTEVVKQQPVTIDRNALAQQVMQQVRPQLEAELRNIAMELFEAQFSALLPSLQLQMEMLPN